jgi:Patatin-like phospholipase
MKGGITSGVIYPGAVEELSREFVFRSIGGTSAGALVAVLAAAAEYQRQQTGSSAGFATLGGLSGELSSRPAGGGPTKLQTLFAPDPGTEKAFRSLEALIKGRRFIGKAFRGGRLWLKRKKTAKALEENFYGFVSGHLAPPDEGITDWLARLIQELAGRSMNDPALTFADLWSPKGDPPPKELENAPWNRLINLELLTTCLTLGIQCHMPAVKRDWRFSRSEMAKLLPGWVVESWVLASRADEQSPGLYHFWPEQMPIVVAARMSMSFPGFFSAIPLYRPNYDLSGKPRQRCWFSDGGITSNFPIDLFDAPIPRRPSFGFNLQPFPEGQAPSDDQSKNIRLRGSAAKESLDRWHRFRENEGLKSLADFGRAVANTMQNWSDTGQAMVPGYRDRIVTVFLDDNEGGSNIDMPSDLIAVLDQRGRAAAQKLIQAYTTNRWAADGLGWDEHRWARLRTMLQVMQDELQAMERGAYPTSPSATASPLSDLMECIGCARTTSPQSYELSKAGALTGRELLEGLLQLSSATGKPDLGTNAPKPLPGHRTWLWQ